jgi:uncharacterized protein with PhoU and TrkA domain
MDYEMTSILEIIAEMDSFSEINDDLSELVARYDDDELAEDDLCLVSAAYSPPPFSEFLKRND